MDQTAPPTTASAQPVVMISAEERGLAAVAHLSGLAGYIVPLGGIIVPIVIWIMKKESRVISSIAKQALILNVVVFLLGVMLVVLAFTIILIPVSIVGGLALALIAIILPVVGALKASDGFYYRYPVVGVTLYS